MKSIILFLLVLALIALYLLFEERNPELVNGYHITTYDSPMSSTIFKKGGSDIVEPVVVFTAISGDLIGAISIDVAVLQEARKSNSMSSIGSESCRYFIVDTKKGVAKGPLGFFEFSSERGDFVFNETSRMFRNIKCPGL